MVAAVSPRSSKTNAGESSLNKTFAMWPFHKTCLLFARRRL